MWGVGLLLAKSCTHGTYSRPHDLQGNKVFNFKWKHSIIAVSFLISEGWRWTGQFRCEIEKVKRQHLAQLVWVDGTETHIGGHAELSIGL